MSWTPSFECENCHHKGGLDDFKLESRTHGEPYIGQVVDAFILVCGKCGYRDDWSETR